MVDTSGAYWIFKDDAREIVELKKNEATCTSEWLGKTGEKIEVEATYERRAWYTCKSFRGYGTETMYIHTFKDASGNLIVWRTSNALVELDTGVSVTVKGTVKEHSDYKSMKETVLTRCKVTAK